MDIGISEPKFRPEDMGDNELGRLWQKVIELETDAQNWEQHYIAWVLVWLTSAPPGTITVCPGYEAGTLLADGETVREQAETLRWSDVQFIRKDENLFVGITIRFVKDHPDPDRQEYVEDQQVFYFVPYETDRYHLDITLLLTSYAIERGLFSAHKIVDSLMAGTETMPEYDDIVKDQAVFVAADHDSTIVPTQEMAKNALDEKLREMCDLTGPLGYCTMSTLQHGPSPEALNEEDTELAEQVALSTDEAAEETRTSEAHTADFEEDIAAIGAGMDDIHNETTEGDAHEADGGSRSHPRAAPEQWPSHTPRQALVVSETLAENDKAGTISGRRSFMMAFVGLTESRVRPRVIPIRQQQNGV